MSNSAIEVLKLLNEYICDNQLALAQYSFLASEKHKKVKDSLNKLQATDEKEEINNVEELKSHLFNLEEYLYFEFSNVFDINFRHIEHFFSFRSNIPPRGCIKVIAGDRLVTLFRHPEFYLKDIEIRPDENTAFKSIAGGEGYYICNDIPQSVQSGEYQNSRINKEAVLEYNKLKFSKISSDSPSQEGYDEDWVKCWEKVTLIDDNQQEIPPSETSYKSTLVIPMSLNTEKLHSDFLSHFQITQNSERAIFGFLCFDHPSINFFDEEKDVTLGYIFADILSLYLIQQLTYTQYSATYYKAKSFVNLRKGSSYT